ncbi:hypothetical protein K435DRAFT_680825 [Dendrothele bispora CBS 962.96]|uniref:DDE Tnp4 domain-containing protein n=1 Tax=Dendrothele bispora (strain CBS 962.96) TaxID=1314807 RepID=A0A4S8LGN7_DENBC|nr:hypothetical protein K435DRAFT_680825 [Dendrothele bispora CBS 962.96]
MPSTTPRQQAVNALHEAFLVQVIAEAEAELHYRSSDGDDFPSSASESESEFDSSTDFDDMKALPSQHILEAMASLYVKRYPQERQPINKSGSQLKLLLTDWKQNRPEIFRSYVRMTPKAFDKLVESIQHHPVFKKDQMEVEKQLVIALYRFGHYGNAASTIKVALWAGIGYGTVRDVTRRVMEACCDEKFRSSVLRWPSETVREKSKQWVEEHSCAAWRNGWLMVDGTLVPLYARPAFFGNTWFDRKSNYSMNVQLVTTPDLRIVDFATGLPGSQHDAAAREETCTFKEHEQLLEEDEFIWADSACPLRNCVNVLIKSELLFDFPLVYVH